MNGSLSNLGTALTLVIAVSILVALVAQIFYILWRRRNLHNRSVPEDTESVLALESSSSQSSGIFSFFLCWKNQSRIEPQEAHNNPAPNRNDVQELDDIIKWQALFGSSRLLFTIEEEERGFGLRDDVFFMCREREVDEESTTPFETPCASPTYYTPSPSPTRE
ncbi:hypothetical protein M0R45_029942 [Rubus argutus]|uniref:Uncharacterized protein n=1 Tax=Rubus argutus TaxID=59490 RepID=A0AAW1WCM8_RUBAR